MCKSLPGSTGFKGMKGSWKAAEPWHCDRSGETTGGSAASVSTETPAWDDPKGGSRCVVQPAWASQTSCVCYGRLSQRSGAAPSPLEPWKLWVNPRWPTLRYIAELWFCSCAQFFPLEIRQYVTCSGFYRSSQLRDFLKRLRTYKLLEIFLKTVGLLKYCFILWY